MSNAIFQMSDAQCFTRSPAKARNSNPNWQIQTAAAVAAWPYHGFGSGWDTGTRSSIYDGAVSGAIGHVSDFVGFMTLNYKNDPKKLYLKREYKLVVTGTTPYVGDETITQLFKRWWSNGFGHTTNDGNTSTIRTGDPATAQPAKNTGLYESLTDTVYTLGGSVTIFQPGSPINGDYDFVFTATLSDLYTWDDALGLVTAALNSIDVPPLPPVGGSSNGVRVTSRIWPNGNGTTAVLTGNDTYTICAARGMLFSGATSGVEKSMLTIATPPHGVNTYNTDPNTRRMMVSAKSKWRLRNKPFLAFVPTEKPFPPFNLYYNPVTVGTNSVTQQPVIDLHTTLNNNGVYEFDTNDFPGRIPPFGFVGAYAPPYSPDGFGEIGFYNVGISGAVTPSVAAASENIGAGDAGSGENL